MLNTHKRGNHIIERLTRGISEGTPSFVKVDGCHHLEDHVCTCCIFPPGAHLPPSGRSRLSCYCFSYVAINMRALPTHNCLLSAHNHLPSLKAVHSIYTHVYWMVETYIYSIGGDMLRSCILWAIFY